MLASAFAVLAAVSTTPDPAGLPGSSASESVGWGDVCEPGVARFQRTARARHKHTY